MRVRIVGPDEYGRYYGLVYMDIGGITGYWENVTDYCSMKIECYLKLRRYVKFKDYEVPSKEIDISVKKKKKLNLLKSLEEWTDTVIRVALFMIFSILFEEITGIGRWSCYWILCVVYILCVLLKNKINKVKNGDNENGEN